MPCRQHPCVASASCTARTAAHRPFEADRFRPRLEEFEGRVVPSATSTLAAPTLSAGLHAAATPHQQVTSFVPLSVTGVSIQNGQLFADLKVGGQTLSVPFTVTTKTNPNDTCPILELHLDPIHLNLLGLTVDTSAICLDITAHEAPGNLLGNLLCDISHLLDQGTPLAEVLAGLTADQQALLTNSVAALAGGALGSDQSVAGASCDILNLSLGPVDLNLLGVEVSLDNCKGGPVTIDVGAQPGAGKLLGNLLCRLTHLLDHHAGQSAINVVEGEIAQVIADLLG